MNSRVLSRISVILCFSLLLSGGMYLLFGPHATYSERENRPLAAAPRLAWDTLLSGEYTAHLSAFCRDHLPFRTAWISLCGMSRLALGQCEYNGILVGKDGYLIPKPNPSDTVTEKNLQAAAAVEQACAARGIPFSVLFAPRAADSLPHHLPDAYAEEQTAPLLCRLESAFAGSTRLVDAFRSAPDPAALRYQTDHHWTTHGAYLAYTALGDRLGFEAKSADFFTCETATDTFYGTSDSKVCLPFTTPDAVTLYRYEGDTRARVLHWESGQETQGFYDWDAIAQKDAYRVFLGGNEAGLTVTLPQDSPKPRMLLIKDSFANALLPFLALHYDVDMVDPRYGELHLSDLVASKDYDCVLLLCGADTISEHEGFLK